MTLSHVILSHAPSLCSKSRKEKKRNINNDLAVLPSHDKCRKFNRNSIEFSLSTRIRSVSKSSQAKSLQPDWEVGVDKDNEDETLVKLEWLEVRKTEAVEIIVDGVDLLEEVRKSKVKDDKVVKAVEEMKNGKK